MSLWITDPIHGALSCHDGLFQRLPNALRLEVVCKVIFTSLQQMRKIRDADAVWLHGGNFLCFKEMPFSFLGIFWKCPLSIMMLLVFLCLLLFFRFLVDEIQVYKNILKSCRLRLQSECKKAPLLEPEWILTLVFTYPLLATQIRVLWHGVF